jgi:uncharacterized membrane protein YczE
VTGPGRPPELEVVILPGRRELARRLPRLAAGLALLGCGVGMLVRAHLGLSPWDVLHQGLSEATGLDFGTVVILVGGAVLVLWWPLHQRPGIGTVLNTALVGLIVDGTLSVLPAPGAIVERLVLLCAGLVACGAGTGLYIGAGLGPGPRDGLMTGIAARGMPIWAVRSALEACALLAGWLLGGNVGVGTILFVLTIGVTAQVSIKRFHVARAAAGLGVAGE